MPINLLAPKIIEIGTSLFMIVGSGHYDLPDRNAVPTATTSVTTTTTTTVEETKEVQAGFNPDEQYFTANTISVSSIKLS